jgi:hypothetical protein
VGSVFYLLIALHNKRGREIFERAHKRQKDKYRTFPSKTAIASMNLATRRKSNKTEAPTGKMNNNGETGTDSDSNSLVKTDGNDSTDSNSEDELVAEAAKKKITSMELPTSAFPYRKDLLHGSDHQSKHPFDCSNESIVFVCQELRHHGFGFLMDNTKLDTYQLDLFMVVSWETLLSIKHKKLKRPSSDTVQELSSNDTLKDLIVSQVESEEESADALINETTTKASMRLTLPPREVQIDAGMEPEEMSLVCYQHSLDLEGCLPKHRCMKLKVKGSGFTGAILSDSATFLSLVELMLCYHAWFHISSKLPAELQEDTELVSFSAGAVVQYFDTIIYRGDDTVDTNTCKIHTQWHANRYFGGPMQSNTETGERGLKTWAKKVARTALKHGRDVFTQSTSNRIGEMLLLNTASELVMRKQANETKVPTSAPAATRATVIHRKVPHFWFETEAQELISLNHQGVETVPDATTGIIQREVLKALLELEREKSQQRFFDIWCEATLWSGQIVRCWPQYQGNQGCKYNWVLAKFQLDDEGDEGVVPYPAKVLAMYEDIDGKFKVLIRLVAYKTTTNVEGLYGDSRLVRHYRLEFNDRSGDPSVYSLPFEDIVKCVVVYESVKYQEPLVPRVRERVKQRKHTVMMIVPKDEWARLFLNLTKELRTQQETMNGKERISCICE